MQIVANELYQDKSGHVWHTEELSTNLVNARMVGDRSHHRVFIKDIGLSIKGDVKLVCVHRDVNCALYLFSAIMDANRKLGS